jgi:hypothetical protein
MKKPISNRLLFRTAMCITFMFLGIYNLHHDNYWLVLGDLIIMLLWIVLMIQEIEK